MATKIITRVICDQCDAEATDTSLPLSFRGKSYEVDLCEKHATQLERAVADILEVARKTKGARRSGGSASSKGLDIKDVREWARKKGISVPSRGRIPGIVLEQYEAQRAS